eukprot:1143517-Pelagomonas_calceolata.AAC.14
MPHGGKGQMKRVVTMHIKRCCTSAAFATGAIRQTEPIYHGLKRDTSPTIALVTKIEVPVMRPYMCSAHKYKQGILYKGGVPPCSCLLRLQDNDNDDDGSDGDFDGDEDDDKKNL